jgi:hypothetical protein
MSGHSADSPDWSGAGLSLRQTKGPRCAAIFSRCGGGLVAFQIGDTTFHGGQRHGLRFVRPGTNYPSFFFRWMERRPGSKFARERTCPVRGAPSTCYFSRFFLASPKAASGVASPLVAVSKAAFIELQNFPIWGMLGIMTPFCTFS